MAGQINAELRKFQGDHGQSADGAMLVTEFQSFFEVFVDDLIEKSGEKDTERKRLMKEQLCKIFQVHKCVIV